MGTSTAAENQKRFVAARKAEGLRRLTLWVRPEDAAALKDITRQPHAIAALRDRVTAEVEAELRPGILARVRAELSRKTRRAMLVQERARARTQGAGSNRPPDAVRFTRKPDRAERDLIKAAGWLYDPVSAIWHLPEDPASWPLTDALLAVLERHGVERLEVGLYEGGA
ncbi:hypothetical protein [Roseobacter sp. HKCCA0434]|uniref:hypothetical protein n=1 Tax=Roseobacter sp. HKCCA0434 TaxID=3079297 RepID=UPI00290598EA|nr:hypothetical protein [Roseobacter sp. HKCCA0434]